jgi:hypothetical protein
MLSGRQYELALPMGIFCAASFYSAVKVHTLDGYYQEPLDGYSFPWQWFVNRYTAGCVRAFLLDKPVRVLAANIDDGSAVYDIPAGMMLVHDLGRIWAMTLGHFNAEYLPVAALIEKMPENSQP